MKVFWARMPLEVGETYCAATKKGLCFIGSPNESFAQLEKWVNHRRGTVALVHEKRYLQPYLVQLNAYLRGEIEAFTIPIDLHGTDFQRMIWEALCQIPYGQTTSYRALAQIVGRPKAVRAVGNAVGANPLLYIVPCHRVVPTSGGLGGFRAGIALKEHLLTIEQESVGHGSWQNN